MNLIHEPVDEPNSWTSSWIRFINVKWNIFHESLFMNSSWTLFMNLIHELKIHELDSWTKFMNHRSFHLTFMHIHELFMNYSWTLVMNYAWTVHEHSWIVHQDFLLGSILWNMNFKTTLFVAKWSEYYLMDWMHGAWLHL